MIVFAVRLLICCGLLSAAAPVPGHSAAVDRRRLDRILAVLRDAPTQAGAACLASMRNVHALEHGQGTAPDDLEFSYQNATQICGADAERVCRTVTALSQQAICKAVDEPS